MAKILVGDSWGNVHHHLRKIPTLLTRVPREKYKTEDPHGFRNVCGFLGVFGGGGAGLQEIQMPFQFC